MDAALTTTQDAAEAKEDELTTGDGPNSSVYGDKVPEGDGGGGETKSSGSKTKRRRIPSKQCDRLVTKDNILYIGGDGLSEADAEVYTVRAPRDEVAMAVTHNGGLAASVVGLRLVPREMFAHGVLPSYGSPPT